MCCSEARLGVSARKAYHPAQGSGLTLGQRLFTDHFPSQLSRRTCCAPCSGKLLQNHSPAQDHHTKHTASSRSDASQMFLLRAKHYFPGARSRSHSNIPLLADSLEPRSRDHSTFPGCNAVCHCRSPDILSTLPPSTKLTWHHIHLVFQQPGANILSWV